MITTGTFQRRKNNRPCLDFWEGYLHMIQYKRLDHTDLDGLNCIDRRDYSSTWCVVKNGVITQEQREFKHPGFSKTHWEQILSEFTKDLKNGSVILFGAFDEQVLIGLSGIEIDKQYGPEKNMFNLRAMWISKAYRRQGIGKQLLNGVKQEAKNQKIDTLHVSATPVPGTVKFYMHEGCTLLSIPDPELFALEPEDIHMTLRL